MLQPPAAHRLPPVRAAQRARPEGGRPRAGAAAARQHREDHVEEEASGADHVQVRLERRAAGVGGDRRRPLHHREGGRGNEGHQDADHEGAGGAGDLAGGDRRGRARTGEDRQGQAAVGT